VIDGTKCSGSREPQDSVGDEIDNVTIRIINPISVSELTLTGKNCKK